MFGPFGPFGIRFDWPEFFVGLATGLVFALVLWRLRAVFGWGLEMLRDALGSLRSGLASRAIDRYQVELISRAESLHLARPIFALDEVLINPQILVPPPPTDPIPSEPLPTDSLSVVPNLPDLNFLSGVYAAHTLSIPDAMREGVDLLLTGEPGSGRSTALAYLAIRLANRDKAMGSLMGKVPFLVHATDLAVNRTRDAIQPLILAAQRTASPGVAAMLPGYIQKHLEQGNVILLLDGLDEIPRAELGPVADWLTALRAQHPGIRIVAAGSARGLGTFAQAGLAPVPIAPWTEYTQREFLAKWARSWQQFVVPTIPKNRISDIDHVLINGWLAGTMRGRTPAEVTLRAWAAYAGDIRGQRSVDDLESYAARMLSPEERLAASAAALAWLKSGQAGILERDMPRGVPVADLVEAGLLVRHEGGRVGFFQPAVGAYFAALAMARGERPDAVELANWQPAEKAMHYLAVLGDVEAAVQRALHSAGDPLDARLFACARWLPDTSNKAEWRGKVLREIAQFVQDAAKPYGLRLRGVHVLARAAEPSVGILFNRMLKSPSASSRVLGALGLGGLNEEGSVDKLVAAAQNDAELLVRQAACLALGAIGTDAAMEGLGQALLGGDEQLRLAAAEALAVHPDEGFGMLREAAEHQEMMTRRAAVFGLSRTPTEWAVEVLQKVKTDDQEWIVRGAAAEALDRRTKPPWKIHRPPTDPAALPWLVAFAAKEGLGVGPGKAAVDMLRRALAGGTLDERIAALEVLSWGSGDQVVLELYKTLNSGDEQLRDAAFESLWRLSATGAELPDPMKYGF